MVIAVDFDGTIVEHRYPEIGEEIPFAIETLKMLIADRHKGILYTMRNGELLDEAVKWGSDRGVEFYAVNSDVPGDFVNDRDKNFSSKVICNIWGNHEKAILTKDFNHFSSRIRSWFVRKIVFFQNVCDSAQS